MTKAMPVLARADQTKSAAPMSANMDLLRQERGAAVFLAVKNLLFWGSILLTCGGLYAGVSLLIG